MLVGGLGPLMLSHQCSNSLLVSLPIVQIGGLVGIPLDGHSEADLLSLGILLDREEEEEEEEGGGGGSKEGGCR